MADSNTSSFFNSSDRVGRLCLDTPTNISLSLSFSAFAALFLFPLSVLLLLVGRGRRSFSHSDVFTLHLAVLEVLALLAVSVLSCGIYADRRELLEAGLILVFASSSGQALFQVLACVDRYLAVVHPVAYLKLKSESGRRLRNAAAGCAWVASLTWIPLVHRSFPDIPRAPFTAQTALVLLPVTFCCASVLRVLRGAGPGEASVARARAFHTLQAVTAVLLLYLLGIMACSGLDAAATLRVDTCTLVFTAMWFTVPSKCVLPLFFLHKTGKLCGFK